MINEYKMRSHILKVLLVSPILLAIGLVLIVFFREKTPRDTSIPLIRESPQGPVTITGINYSTYVGGKLIRWVKADEFKIRPRKLHFLFNMRPIINIKPIFNIRPLNEAILSNVTMEVHLYPEISEETGEISEEAGLLFSDKNLLSFDSKEKGMGVITRGVIKGLTMDIYKGDRPNLVVKADEVRIHPRKKEAKLINASIQDISSQKHIMSKLIIWSEKERVFKIPGLYIVADQKRKTTGKGIKLNLNFVSSSLL